MIALQSWYIFNSFEMWKFRKKDLLIEAGVSIQKHTRCPVTFWETISIKYGSQLQQGFE